MVDYPELSAHRKAVQELARSECRLRCQTGDHDFRKDFSSRFPDMDLECATLRDAATIATPTHSGRCKSCPLVRPQHIGRYAVESLIGGGAYGVVYRCRHPELDRVVAIKVTRDASGSAAAFLHEAQNAAGLAHPNIVGLFDYGKLEDGRPYIVYEYVAGRTLAERIAARDYTMGEAIRWTIALAGALQAAHRRHIYHRDIKPANILVDEEGVVRLTDFGMARRDDVFYFDDRGARLGTPCYMSPEQASCRSDWAGPASDIYSLGVVLYELLCGRVPFRDMDLESLLAQIKERAPVSLRSLNERIPARVEEACLRALDKDPAKRFRTAGDFARALQTAIEPRTRRTWLAVAAAALVVMGLLCFGLHGHNPPAASAPDLPLKLECPGMYFIKGRELCEVRPESLPIPGDKLQISAKLSQGKGYLYVIVLDGRQRARVLWPNLQTDPAEPPISDQSPPDRFVTVPSGDGVMAVLVGAVSKPLQASDLNGLTAALDDLTDKGPGWPAPTRTMWFPAIAHHAAEKPAYLVVRGAGSQPPFDFSPGVKQIVEKWFDTYYAVMFPWFKAPPPGSATP
jgi:serine/threonine-protein kinase